MSSRGYCRAVDRLDMAALRQVYHPDAVDDHGSYAGGVDGLLEHVVEVTGNMTQLQHRLGQCLIELASPDVAVVETYFMVQYSPDPPGDGQPAPDSALTFGRYVDRAERRDGSWRIAQRTVVYEGRVIARTGSPAASGPDAQQHRGPDDPIYRYRAAAGLPS
ncbi:MAG: nuclear transport factor 2 family protein [Ilumatobacteraceae bacterium]